MADKIISDFTAATTLAAADLLEIENAAGNSRKITAQNAATALKDLSPATAWALAGAGQTATGIYDFAVDGAKANIIFTGLGSFNELLIVARGLTNGTSGTRAVRVSVDNGSTFFTTSGDYVSVDNAGVEANVTVFATHATSSTAARSLIAHITNMKGAVKHCLHHNTTDIMRLFVASSSDINAVNVFNAGGGNMTAGTVRVYAR